MQGDSNRTQVVSGLDKCLGHDMHRGILESPVISNFFYLDAFKEIKRLELASEFINTSMYYNTSKEIHFPSFFQSLYLL